MVRLCTHKECALYFLRFGHNPARRGAGGRRATKDRVSLLKNPNSVNDSKILAKGTIASKGKCISSSLGASGGEKQPIKMEAIGKVQMLDNKIIIEW